MAGTAANVAEMSRPRIKPRIVVADLEATVLTWSPNQLAAARLRAIGYTQQMVADELGTPFRTVQDWCAMAGFDQYVRQLHERAWTRVEPAMMANLELAIDIQRRMLITEIAHDDGRYLEARRIIDRLLDRLLYVEPPTAGPSQARDGNGLVTPALLGSGEGSA